MSAYTIRQAQLNDTTGIARVHVGTWQYAYQGQIPDSYLQSMSVEKRTEAWQNILSHPEQNSHTLVAVEGDNVLGFCSVDHCRDEDMDKKTGEVWAIYVDKDHMGQGVGTALMKQGLDYLRDQGYTKAILWVLTSNEKTRRWYESRGWDVEGKEKTEQSKGFDIHETRYKIAL